MKNLLHFQDWCKPRFVSRTSFARIIEVDCGTLSITCHPEGPFLAEGSPGMLQPEMLWLGSHQKTYVSLAKSLESAIQSDTLREILRAKEALQDDSG